MRISDWSSDVCSSDLTKEEWDYIQGEIDIINDLWPQIEEMERRINGIAPPKVEALPIVTRHGTYNGGYYPLVADSTQNPEIERRKGKSEDLFESLYTKEKTRHGLPHERTGPTYKQSGRAPGRTGVWSEEKH